MHVPDFVPILSSGAHDDPRKGACVMEMASFLAGEKWSDSPACTHRVLASMARKVNDTLGDDERQSLLALLPRLMGTSDGADDHVLSVRLAVWCARQVAHLNRDPRVGAAINAAQAWADCPCSEHATAAYAAATAIAIVDTYAAYAAATAASDATAAYDASDAYAAHAASDAAAYAASAVGGGGVQLLSGLIDEYDRLTGRTTHPDVTDADLARIREHITA